MFDHKKHTYTDSLGEVFSLDLSCLNCAYPRMSYYPLKTTKLVFTPQCKECGYKGGVLSQYERDPQAA